MITYVCYLINPITNIIDHVVTSSVPVMDEGLPEVIGINYIKKNCIIESDNLVTARELRLGSTYGQGTILKNPESTFPDLQNIQDRVMGTDTKETVKQWKKDQKNLLIIDEGQPQGGQP